MLVTAGAAAAVAVLVVVFAVEEVTVIVWADGEVPNVKVKGSGLRAEETPDKPL